MFKTANTDNHKNFISATDLVTKGMQKRRKLAYSAILNVCDRRAPIRVVK